MQQRDVIAHIARRLPHRTRRDVKEVIDLLAEIWQEQLLAGEMVIIPIVGKLTIEIQDMKAGGALQHHVRFRRVYGRFRPSPSLKQQFEASRFEPEK